MRAIVLEDFEGGPRLREVPIPQITAPNELLIRVQASSINGFDLAVAGGRLKGMMEHRFPVVLGKDYAGTVEAIGPEVSRFAVGDQVFGVLMKPVLGDGTFAEYVTVPESSGIAKVPAGLALQAAGALGLSGTAAVMSVAAIAPAAGETVLISGATGGVGACAVQLAAGRGAQVIATALPGDQADFVRSLGATHTVDYKGDLAAAVRAIRPGVWMAPSISPVTACNWRSCSSLTVGSPLPSASVPTSLVAGRCAQPASWLYPIPPCWNGWPPTSLPAGSTSGSSAPTG